MKFFSILTITMISAVTFLYYLFTNPNFLPTNQTGEYDWLNISFVVVLSLISIFSLLSILIAIVLRSINKQVPQSSIYIVSIKQSLVITIGFFIVFTLNFFNILNWIWGVAILIVVLVIPFII